MKFGEKDQVFPDIGHRSRNIFQIGVIVFKNRLGREGTYGLEVSLKRHDQEIFPEPGRVPSLPSRLLQELVQQFCAETAAQAVIGVVQEGSGIVRGRAQPRILKIE